MSAAADLVLLNGTIHAEPGSPPSEALAIRDGRVIALGTIAEMRALGSGGRREIDLGARVVLPGFVDAHAHLLWWSLGRRRVQIDGVETLESALDQVQQEAARGPEGAWIEGAGWNKNVWGEFPTRAELDRVAPRRPIALLSKDGHALWANSLAFAIAGVGEETPDPPGGRLLRDDHGEPTGILLERAMGLVLERVPAPDVRACAEALREGIPRALSFGVTGAHDLGFPGVPYETVLAAYRSVEEVGDLMLRVALGIPYERLDWAIDQGLRTGQGSGALWLGHLKVFADGALGPQTAAMLEPYERSTDSGILRIEPAALEAAIRRAGLAGIAVAIHAIGDAAVRLALDSLEKASDARRVPAAPSRIEHAQIVHPDDVGRFNTTGVIASMQPIHATSDRDIADRFWSERARHAYAWRALADAGAVLALGTDAPVESLEPLKNLYAAVTRRREGSADAWYPEQRLTLAEAIRAYTLGSAIAAGQAADLGTLTPGKRADLVVLDRDVFAEAPEALLEARVDLTLLGGVVAHER